MKTTRTGASGWRWLVGLGVAVLAGCSTPLPPQVIVVGDVTAEGQKLELPSAGHPTYYFPVVVGDREMGASVAGEKMPVKNEVLHTLAMALAKQHYLVMDAAHPPEQLMIFWWGSMNPEIQGFGSGDPTEQVFFNEREMLALVGAYKAGRLATRNQEELRTAARDDRYFVILMAFDYAAARQRQKKLLWMAKMSTAAVGTDLPSVIPALAASGRPAFGRDTTPDWVDSGKVREESVIIAPLEVKGTVPEKK